jgi:hypothetical protein
VAAAYGRIAGITQVNVQVPVAAGSSNPVNAFIGGAPGQIQIGH